MSKLHLVLITLLITFLGCGGEDGGSGSHTALCNDGTFSDSQNCSGTCSGHGGVKEWYVNCGAAYLNANVNNGKGEFYGLPTTPIVDSNDGSYGDTIEQSGWGFTPYGVAELHFIHEESGVEEIDYENVFEDGTYQCYYEIPVGKAIGIWQYYAVDLASGLLSEQVSYEIEP